jgi:hypothetical protein
MRSGSRGSTASESSSASQGTSQHRTQSHTRSSTHQRGESHGGSKGTSEQHSESESVAINAADTRGQTLSTGASEGFSTGEARGDAETTGVSQSSSSSQQHTVGFTAGVQETPLARHKIVQRPSGHLQVSVQDQLYAIMNCLAGLAERLVLVKCKGMGSPFVVKVHEVQDPYVERKLVRSPAWKTDETQRYLRSIYSAHPYYFVEAQRHRVSAAGSDPVRELDADRRSRMSLDAPVGKESPFDDG